jgi:hypothetical protein
MMAWQAFFVRPCLERPGADGDGAEEDVITEVEVAQAAAQVLGGNHAAGVLAAPQRRASVVHLGARRGPGSRRVVIVYGVMLLRGDSLEQR